MPSPKNGNSNTNEKSAKPTKSNRVSITALFSEGDVAAIDAARDKVAAKLEDEGFTVRVSRGAFVKNATLAALKNVGGDA